MKLTLRWNEKRFASFLKAPSVAKYFLRPESALSNVLTGPKRLKVWILQIVKELKDLKEAPNDQKWPFSECHENENITWVRISGCWFPKCSGAFFCWKVKLFAALEYYAISKWHRKMTKKLRFLELDKKVQYN